MKWVHVPETWCQCPSCYSAKLVAKCCQGCGKPLRGSKCTNSKCLGDHPRVFGGSIINDY